MKGSLTGELMNASQKQRNIQTHTTLYIKFERSAKLGVKFNPQFEDVQMRRDHGSGGAGIIYHIDLYVGRDIGLRGSREAADSSVTDKLSDRPAADVGLADSEHFRNARSSQLTDIHRSSNFCDTLIPS